MASQEYVDRTGRSKWRMSSPDELYLVEDLLWMLWKLGFVSDDELCLSSMPIVGYPDEGV